MHLLFALALACQPAPDAPGTDPPGETAAEAGGDTSGSADDDTGSAANDTDAQADDTNPEINDTSSADGDTGLPPELMTMLEEQADCYIAVGLEPLGYQPERVPDDVCACVIAMDGRPGTPAEDQTGVDPPEPDTRHDDYGLAELEEHVQRTYCSCCHDGPLEGPGTWFWDIAYDGVWLDSAPSDRLRKLAWLDEETGEPLDVIVQNKGQNLVLPTQAMADFRAAVEAEVARREAGED